MTPDLKGVLQRVEEVRAEGQLPVVVLDLDSTLIHTGSRHLEILTRYAAQRAPHLAETVATVEADEFSYLVEGPLRARGIDDEALLADVRAFWRDRFFTSELCRYDRPAPGAVAFARRVVELGGLAYYLTARPVDMAEGTLYVLRRDGFPVLRGRGLLHMKPSVHLDDQRFKQGAVTEIESLGGTVVATFENEPVHAAMLLRAFPAAIHFLVGSVRSPTAPTPHPALIPVASFHV